MPSPVVGENIDGLEPASPIYNFRYPNMLRLRYEKKRNLPRALLAVGDAYTSADPVSGLGMTLGAQGSSGDAAPAGASTAPGIRICRAATTARSPRWPTRPGS